MKFFVNHYNALDTTLTLASDGKNLTGLWFEGQRHFMEGVKDFEDKSLAVFDETKEWLFDYFQGKNPSKSPPLKPFGTEFQLEVWEILKKIPYGKTSTYKEIAEEIKRKRGLQKMSARAIGGAVGRNPISIIIPCHRVIASNGKLSGYAGGLDIKEKLLALEGAARSKT